MYAYCFFYAIIAPSSTSIRECFDHTLGIFHWRRRSLPETLLFAAGHFAYATLRSQRKLRRMYEIFQRIDEAILFILLVCSSARKKKKRIHHLAGTLDDWNT